MKSFSLHYDDGIFVISNSKTNEKECEFCDKEMLLDHIEHDFGLPKDTAKKIIKEAELHGVAEI